MVVLNERQKNILLDLESSDILIAGKMLAAKFHVSLRTIRNDIDAISKYVEENGGQFIRIPGQGMKVIANSSMSNHLMMPLSNKDFHSMNEKERSMALVVQFLFSKSYLPVNKLTDEFDVSRGTILSTIKIANQELQKYRLALVGYKNKGYLINGKIRDIIHFAEKKISEFTDEILYHLVIQPGNHLASEKESEKIKEFINFLSNNLYLFIAHYYTLAFLTLILIKNAEQSENSEENSQVIIDSKLNKVASYLKDNFSIQLSAEQIAMLYHILSSNTDYTESIYKSNIGNELSEAVDDMIQYVKNSGMYTINDEENLKIDLLIHLKSTLDSKRLGLPRDNPLLDEIKQNYPNEFQLIKSATAIFQEKNPLKFDDNEVGYITLYFLRSFEKAQKIQDTRIMVVCNSGRSASKLLSTRLLNNIPNIHIVAMDSAFNVEKNEKIADNIDFIISTVPLKAGNKPSILVSPLLNEEEIEKVKEAIWISKRQQTGDNKNLDEVTSIFVNRYEQYKDGDIYTKENETSKSSSNYKNIIPVDSMEILGEVVMDLWEMLEKLYPREISKKKYNNVSGIFAHVMMSIPRWQRGEFITPMDYEELTAKYPKECSAIQEFLDKVSKKIGVFIAPAEVVAILRYFIY